MWFVLLLFDLSYFNFLFDLYHFVFFLRFRMGSGGDSRWLRQVPDRFYVLQTPQESCHFGFKKNIFERASMIILYVYMTVLNKTSIAL